MSFSTQRNQGRIAGLIVIACLLCAVAGWAQEYRGTVTGIVLDSSQAAVPDVELSLTNTATNVAAKTVSTVSGAYNFPLVQPGAYKLEARKAGFKSAVLDGIVVQTGASVGRNIVLQVGEVQQTVEVTAAAPLLNITTANQGQVINQIQIQELPMQGRSPYALARLAPGVIPAGFLNSLMPYDVGGNSFVSISGSRRYSVEFALNGVPNTSPGGLFSGFLAYTPPADSTQEFQVVTNGFDAQYGHNGGGLISVTTKSGGNDFHGSLYEYIQNDKLNANSFYNNLNKARKSPNRFNQFGGGIGGPVLIPRMFNGKDKAFFFFSYEGIRNSGPGSSYATLPTSQMRGGDFSQLTARGVTVYNPFQTTTDATGKVTRAPFANNQIPASLINPISKQMLGYVPQPTAGGSVIENNYFTQVNNYNVYDNFLGRLDLNFSSKNRFFVSIGQYTRTQDSGNLFHNVATGSGADWPMWNAAIDDTHVISPTMVLNARLGFTRYTQDSVPGSFDFDPSQLGLPSSYVSQLPYGMFPAVSFGTGFRGFGASSPYIEHDYHYFATVMATWTQSRHSLKIGWEAREQQNNIWNSGNPAGSFSFNGVYGSGPGLSASPGFGTDVAQFLLGLPSGGSVDNNSSFAARGRYYALFLQDDWKLTPSLTLNLGFRYDIESPNYEKHNRQTTGWLNGPNPIAAQAIANYTASPDAALAASQFKVNGGILYPGQSGAANGWWDREWGRFQPRVGLAWNPDILSRRLSFRAGFGITYYTMTPVAPDMPGYSANTPLVSTADNGATFLASLSNPYPSGISKPRGNADGAQTFLGLGMNLPQREVPPPRSNRWLFSMQFQASKQDMIELNYNGHTQNHIAASVPLNFIPAHVLGTSITRDQAALDYLNTPVKNPFQGLIPASTSLGRATISRYQLLYAFPQYTTVFLRNENSGSETFNGAYVSWERRYGHGLTVLTNYQFSKQLWARRRLNATDTMLVRELGSEDRPHQFTFSATYELPFGKGRALGGNAVPVISKIISGWQLNAIFFKQSGSLLQWGPLVFTGSSWGDIMNLAGRGTHSPTNGAVSWFNTSVFDLTPARQPNAPNNQTQTQYRYFPFEVPGARAPGAQNFDFSMGKRTQITERFGLQFRAEFFNIANHPVFGSPNMTYNSALFGKITSQANIPRAIQLGLRLTY
jgi:hypothetical protein